MKKEQRLVREAFRRAGDGVEPDVDRLVAAVPAMIAEAERRRSIRPGADALALVVPIARRLIPRMAAAAVLLVVAASFVAIRDSGAETSVAGSAAPYDALLLTGEVDGQVSDVLLEAMVREDEDHG